MSEKQKNKEKQKSPYRAFLKKAVKTFLFFFLFFLIILFFGLFYLNHSLESNKTKVLENLPFLNQGKISFDDAHISIFKDFPYATISLNNILVQDSLFEKHQKPLLQLGNVSATVSLKKIWEQKIEISGISLKDGAVNMLIDSSRYSNWKSILSQKNDIQTGSKNEGFQINSNNLDLNFSNVFFHYEDAIKRTKIHVLIQELNTETASVRDSISATLEMNIDVKELTFKKEKGSFLKNSKVNGLVDLGLKNGVLKIFPFDLKINEEQFLFDGKVYLDGSNTSVLNLENKHTQLSEILPLLPKEIHEKIKPYKINAPFYSKTTIIGTFKEGDRPLVDVTFNVEDKNLIVKNFEFEKVNFEGHFTNKIFQDEQISGNKKDRLTIELKNLNAKYGVFHIRSPKLLVTSTPETGPILGAQVAINGAPSGISKWLENDNFFFEGGQFSLKADLKGPLNDYNELITESEAKLELRDFDLNYTPSDVSFPFSSLVLKKELSDANFKIVSGFFRKNQNYELEGYLKELATLILDRKQPRVSSDIKLSANKIGWLDFINLFGKSGLLNKKKTKTDIEKKKSMKKTIRGMDIKFQPHISVGIDTLFYYDLLELNNLITGVYFEDNKTLVLEKTSFDYDKGNVKLEARLDISQDYETPFEFELEANHVNLKRLLPSVNYFDIKLLKSLENYPKNLSFDIKHQGILDDSKGLISSTSEGEITFEIDDGATLFGTISYHSKAVNAQNEPVITTHIHLEGDPKVFNDFFKTEQFFFDKGRFFVDFDYSGEVLTVEDLMSQVTASFSLQNSEVYYKAVDVHFPLTRIDLDLEKNIADYYFHLFSDTLQQEINFKGEIKNFAELIFGTTGEHLESTINITSPELEWDVFLAIFAPKETSKKEQDNIEVLKNTVKNIYKTFDPEIQVDVEKFIYSDQLFVENLKSGIHLIDSSYLVLERTEFDFHDGKMGINGQLNLSQKKQIPFEVDFHTDDLDVVRLLKSLDYLSIETLQNIEKLSGRITMDFQLEGVLLEGKKGLIPEKTKGSINLDLHNVVIEGFPAIDTIAEKIRMERRFQTLRFAPITNRFIINGKNISIPQMEIQSNALNMFIEGLFSYDDDKTNIWISVPLDNINRRNLASIPPKRGYSASRKKVYIEVYTNDKGENEFKLHLSKKKFYKDRGILDQYKKDKKRNRQTRWRMR